VTLEDLAMISRPDMAPHKPSSSRPSSRSWPLPRNASRAGASPVLNLKCKAIGQPTLGIHPAPSRGKH
jgi:hypothetical protein